MVISRTFDSIEVPPITEGVLINQKVIKLTLFSANWPIRSRAGGCTSQECAVRLSHWCRLRSGWRQCLHGERYISLLQATYFANLTEIVSNRNLGFQHAWGCWCMYGEHHHLPSPWGFPSNAHPNPSHPRWSMAWQHELGPRPWWEDPWYTGYGRNWNGCGPPCLGLWFQASISQPPSTAPRSESMQCALCRFWDPTKNQRCHQRAFATGPWYEGYNWQERVCHDERGCGDCKYCSGTYHRWAGTSRGPAERESIWGRTRCLWKRTWSSRGIDSKRPLHTFAACGDGYLWDSGTFVLRSLWLQKIPNHSSFMSKTQLLFQPWAS